MMQQHDVRSLRASANLAESITRRASRHTFLTIRLLVDRARMADAFRAYAYFRWVDDEIDLALTSRSERSSFLSRQSDLIESAYRGEEAADAVPEERIVIDLIRGDPRRESGLACYIRGLMDVIAFDAWRRGRAVAQSGTGRLHPLAGRRRHRGAALLHRPGLPGAPNAHALPSRHRGTHRPHAARHAG
jgi:hypothetical protein